MNDVLDAAGCSGDAVDDRPCRAAVAQRVRGLGVSGQQHGLVALDADCAVIRPGTGALARSTCRRGTAKGALFGIPLNPVRPCSQAVVRRRVG